MPKFVAIHTTKGGAINPYRIDLKKEKFIVCAGQNLANRSPLSCTNNTRFTGILIKKHTNRSLRRAITQTPVVDR